MSSRPIVLACLPCMCVLAAPGILSGAGRALIGQFIASCMPCTAGQVGNDTRHCYDCPNNATYSLPNGELACNGTVPQPLEYIPLPPYPGGSSSSSSGSSSGSGSSSTGSGGPVQPFAPPAVSFTRGSTPASWQLGVGQTLTLVALSLIHI